MDKETVEVPIVWLKKLMEVGAKADVKVYNNGIVNGWAANRSTLEHLKGYILSAEQFIPTKESKGQDNANR